LAICALLLLSRILAREGRVGTEIRREDQGVRGGTGSRKFGDKDIIHSDRESKVETWLI